jgi:hypothetical protein
MVTITVSIKGIKTVIIMVAMMAFIMVMITDKIKEIIMVIIME